MDCCNGWTTEKIHGDECPVFNRWMDYSTYCDAYLRNTPQINEGGAL